MEIKICSKCGKELPVSEFSKNSKAKDGLQSQCKSCQSAAHKEKQERVKKLLGETVLKVKHSSVRIENPLLALYRGTGYFSLARTFRTVWGG